MFVVGYYLSWEHGNLLNNKWVCGKYINPNKIDICPYNKEAGLNAIENVVLSLLQREK